MTQAVQEYPDLPILRAMRGHLRLLHTNEQKQLTDATDDFTAAIDKNALLSHRYGHYLMQISRIMSTGFKQ